MKKILEIGLGIVAALGGFVDVGDLVFATQAGAKFGLHLLWALALGTLLIMLFAEMSGRVAAVAKLPVFTIIRRRFPRKLAFTTLVASTMVNLLTLAAEIGGVALVLQLLADLPYRPLIVMVGLALVLIIWYLPFQALEKIFGYLGLGLLVLVVAALKTHPDWHAAATGLVPHLTAASQGAATYWYYAVGIIAATLMPYEVYFYASGAIEEKWKPSDLIVNKINTVLGFLLGGLLVAGIMMVSTNLFMGPHILPEFISTPALAALIPYGQAGLLLALLGMLFTISGAAIETCFAGAYNIAQYYGLKWGKHTHPLKVPRFTLIWIIMLMAGTLLILTGFDPITVTEYAVIFSVLVMPFTYLAILLAAKDRRLMGEHTNKTWNTVLGWVGLGVIVAVSLAAVPLMVVTQRGSL
jgi:manganese transport protein